MAYNLFDYTNRSDGNFVQAPPYRGFRPSEDILRDSVSQKEKALHGAFSLYEIFVSNSM